MDIFSTENYKKTTNALSKRSVILIISLIVCVALYIISFSWESLMLSLIVGIFSCILCFAIYYTLIFENHKIKKLITNAKKGIIQENKYIFVKYDGETERDGVKLTKIETEYYDENKKFSRTLYFVTLLPHPQLKVNTEYTFSSYQNIITSVKE